MTNASANQIETTKLTQATYDRLVAELEDLTTRGRVEIAQAIETARALGDLSENGDYHAAKDAQGKMESRVRQLQRMLKEVEIVDEAGADDGSVSLGSTVTLRYEGDDEDDTQQFFVGSIEERQGNLPVVSPSSPLGQVLIGRSAGDAVEYKAPGGTLKVHITAVDLMAPRTLTEKIWDAHVVHAAEAEPDLLFIDLHLLHEVTSPQAFDGIRLAGRTVRRPDLTVATADHNVPTLDIDKPVADPISAQQLKVLDDNTAEFGIICYPMGHANQGIVHIIGPEQGWTQPGMTIVCGDSHTSTHGAFGAIAFGIGTSEVEHVLATQTLSQVRPKTMSVTVDGDLAPGVTAKDVALAIIGAIGTGGGIGHIIEYRGSAIRGLSMEGRMTLCNMSIEGGARAGLVAPDETTFAYVKDRDRAPQGDDWDAAVAYWRTLPTDDGATFDKEVVLDAAAITPHVTWGTNPAQVVPIAGNVPDPEAMADPGDREAAQRALAYMGLEAGTPMREISVDTVFLGSCTNSRIEDFRAAAAVLEGRSVHKGLRALAVPGSHRVKAQAEAEGLDKVFTAAGFEWREPGCSMCLAMNPDKLAVGERCASTSNRNFEGRQGRGGRTHLVSPAVAAATAVAGTFATPEDLR